MGVHRERLAASKAHRRFDEGIRAALRRMGRTVPSPSDISPVMVGAKLLPFAAPLVMEEALSYGGPLRFVAFGYSPRTRRFGHCDGGDDIPTESDTWLPFLHHPLVAHQLPKSRYPTLYGVFCRNAPPSLKELMESEGRQTEPSEPAHWLLLDRQTRRLYLCQRAQAILFFSLTEPNERETGRLFIDGLRMSLGDETYKVAASPELVAQLFACLDDLKHDARGRSPIFGLEQHR